MTYTELDKFCDASFARNFEGLPLFQDFSPEQLNYIFEENKWM